MKDLTTPCAHGGNPQDPGGSPSPGPIKDTAGEW